ncbi:MAG: ABC transporter permease [Planctomycetota bacterium]|jgi:ribose transport system permease protein
MSGTEDAPDGAMKSAAERALEWAKERGRAFRWSTQTVVLLAAVVLWILLGVLADNFLTGRNIQNLMRQMAIQGVIGIGAVLVILTAGIDLSVGSLIAVVNVVLAMMMVQAGLPIWLAIVLVLLMAACIGLVNGVMVYDLRLPPFIATLGMMIVLRGAALLVSRGRTISGLPRSVADFTKYPTLYIPNLFWILIVVTVVVEVVLRRTTFGRYVYAIGSNREAARLSGVNTRLVTYGVYMLASFLGGVAGCMVTARNWQGSPNAGTTFELDAIAAAVLGGASLMGAEGTPVGAFIGALVMVTIYNGCNLLGVDSNWTKVIVGVILIATVAVDQFRKRRSGD